jgi:hypothetical protein
MPTNREIVSRVKNQLRLLSKDANLNDRFILFTAENIAETYLSKKARNRALYRYDNLYKDISCVELIDVNTYKCDIVEFRSCKKLKRSKKKLPELVYSRYGGSIKEVTAIDGGVDFKPSTVAQHRRDGKRQKVAPGVNYFYIKDGYLWIPDSDIEMVNIYILALDQYDLDNMSNCPGDDETNCMSAWEYDFVISSDMLEQVIRETIQQVSITIQIQEDENPNLDSNIKSQTV